MAGRRRVSGLGAVLPLALAACGGGGGGGDSPSDGLSYPAHVAAHGAAPYLCGAAGTTTVEVMQDLNKFWQSSVTACSCQFDAPGICTGGGFVGTDPGYIYYDAQALGRLDQISGSRLPADMVMAHEFGHTIQLWLGLQTFGKFKELQADCLAGYYVGSRIRRGTVNQNDITSTFATSCNYGDPYLAPWYEPSAHGVCSERVGMLKRGIDGQLAGLLPGQACS